MPIPCDTDAVENFAKGLDGIVVIEEKNPTLERLVRDALYATTFRPVVVGKKSENGDQLLPSYGRLDADHIIPALRARLTSRLGDRLRPEPPSPRERITLAVQRTPFFCSGCPHNWGTKVPEGAVVGMGTGCHGMTLLMDEDRVGDSIGITAMGNEGAQWLGMAPFVATEHVFQNFGDGTYFHSGQLAIQAAIGAGANITFKILYNHTVAMTGGQEASHRVNTDKLAEILLAHGVSRVTITTDDVDAYRRMSLPRGVDVVDRTKIIAVQEELASISGVTVLIHDQGCAAETRRARKRGFVETPRTRVVINHRICEGCGDCGDKSNCLSVQPVDTPLGRKTQIDQASCNLDLSCLEGDCPAFMTVEVDPRISDAPPMLPPLSSIDVSSPTVNPASTAIRLAGIGGTGVVTIAQIIGTAATISGGVARGLDQTGLSQKAGPVISDITIVPITASDANGGVSPRRSNAPGEQQVEVVLAFDRLVGTHERVLAGVHEGTTVFASSTATPTGRQVSDPAIANPSDETLDARFSNASGTTPFTIDATRAAKVLTGSTATANMLLLGAAIQAGVTPLDLDVVRRAIELNGVQVDSNLRALEWGRRFYASPGEVARLIDSSDRCRVDVEPLPAGLVGRVEALELTPGFANEIGMLTGDVVAHQDKAQGSRFLTLVEASQRAGGETLSGAVARGFHKLLTYKDEYEVARLMLRSDGLAAAREITGDDDPSVTWHLHPPSMVLLGLDRKIRFGSRTRPVFAALARAKRLRGTRLDPFGRSELRRLERSMIEEYEEAVGVVIRAFEAGNLSLEKSEQIVSLPDMVRGFEALKLRRATAYRARLSASIEPFRI